MATEELNNRMFASAAEYLKDSRAEIEGSFVDFVAACIGDRNIDSFIDVGCGIGYLTHAVKSLCPKAAATGVDLSRELISVAINDNRDAIGFLVGDAYDLEFEDDVFDLSISHTLFIHLSRPLVALREMIRVIKPGGQVLLFEPLIHADGMGSYVPGQGAVKKSQRDKLFRFDLQKKSKSGIDMHIAPKLPSMLLDHDLKNLAVKAYNHIAVKAESESVPVSEIKLSSYETMMVELGYPKSEIDALLRNESLFKSVPGEFNLVTILGISGTK